MARHMEEYGRFEQLGIRFVVFQTFFVVKRFFSLIHKQLNRLETFRVREKIIFQSDQSADQVSEASNRDRLLVPCHSFYPNCNSC